MGVIGVGGMGSGHCAWMHKIEEARLSAVCDTDPGALAAAQGKYSVPGFSSAISLLDSGLVDAVIVATPHYDHPEIAIEAFQRGIHVLSEKPIAVSVDRADAMITAARESGSRFGVMYQMRSTGRFQAARRIAEEGRLGEIYRTQLVLGWYRSQAYYNSGGWRATWAGEGGGVLINQAPHFLDLFAWIGGLPSRITATTRTRLHDIEVEDEVFATLDYPNGAHGYLYCSTTEAPSHEWLEICGDRGKLVVHGSSLRLFEIPQSIRCHNRDATEMWGGPEVREVEVEIAPGGGEHTDITRSFCRSVLYGEPMIAPGEEGLWAVEIVNACILSSKTGAPAELPVGRKAYAKLLAGLVAGSQEKHNVNEQRVLDTHYAGR